MPRVYALLSLVIVTSPVDASADITADGAEGGGGAAGGAGAAAAVSTHGGTMRASIATQRRSPLSRKKNGAELRLR